MVKMGVSLVLVAASLLVAAGTIQPIHSDSAKIVFDLPDTVECRDVTPTDFAEAHPSLKVIEAKFRISARIVAGSESEIVDFLYIIASPDKKMQVPRLSAEHGTRKRRGGRSDRNHRHHRERQGR